MTLYNCYVNPHNASDFRLVKSGFAWSAFFRGIFWFLRHKMWFEFFMSLVPVTILVIVLAILPPDVRGGIIVLSLIWFGCEAFDLQHDALIRQGYMKKAIFYAKNEDEAEMMAFQIHENSLKEPV